MTVFSVLLPLFTEYGYLALFMALLVCGLGVPVPEDIALVTGGVIAGLGFGNVHAMVVVGLTGVLAGDGISFILGRIYGDRVIRLPILRRVLPEARIAQAKSKFSTYGRGVMFIARFLPGLRTPVYFTAGMTRRVTFTRWLLMDGAAAVLSVPIWVYLGYFGARNFEWLFERVANGQLLLLGVLLTGALVAGGLWWRRSKRNPYGKSS
jgi:membrane protein DedA with SNARE-associated domain